MTFMRKMCLDATSTYVYNDAQDVLWRYLFMRSRLKVISKMCIYVHRGCFILTKCKMSFMWSSRLQGALARARCRLVAATMGANVQRVLLANLGSPLLANSAYSTDCVKGTAQGRKEVDHCRLHAYYFYYGCYYFCSSNACFSLSLWGLIYLIAMFAFG